MYELLRRWVLALLKVPPEPHPPIGAPASLRVFRAGRSYYKLRMAGWAATQVFVLGAFLFWTAILVEVESQVHEQKTTRAGRSPSDQQKATSDAATIPQTPSRSAPRSKNALEHFTEGVVSAADNISAAHRGKDGPGISGWVAGYKKFFVELALLLPPWVFPLTWVVKIVSFIVYLVQLPLTYAVRRLDYEMRWYMVTDRSLRLRHGVWRVAESTMSFANVQQVTVTQGPLQRLLGLADLKVQSAGGGSNPHSHEQKGDDMHLGVFRHVTNAPEIRDLILDRLRRFRETGIGDPDETSARTPAVATLGIASDQTLAAARELLAEARALRATLS